jgi:hypothetical protein
MFLMETADAVLTTKERRHPGIGAAQQPWLAGGPGFEVAGAQPGPLQTKVSVTRKINPKGFATRRNLKIQPIAKPSRS